jgi:hypothetical protein
MKKGFLPLSFFAWLIALCKSRACQFIPLFLIFFLSLLYKPLLAQQIDSIQQKCLPTYCQPFVQTAFNLFISDTAGISAVHVSFKYPNGVEFYQNDFASPFVVYKDTITNLPYLNISTGVHAFIPPFIDAYLVKQDGSFSPVAEQQLVY